MFMIVKKTQVLIKLVQRSSIQTALTKKKNDSLTVLWLTKFLSFCETKAEKIWRSRDRDNASLRGH